MDNQLVWLKRDLRIRDHGPLYRATNHGPTIILYVYEPTLIESKEFDSSHFKFINECLKELDRKLQEIGGIITYREGRLPEVFQNIHQSHPIESILAHQETGNMKTYRRDDRVRNWASKSGVAIKEIPQTGVVRQLESRDGWAQKWENRMRKPIFDSPVSITVPDDIDHESRRSLSDLELENSNKNERQKGGESRARRTLTTFLYERGESYGSDMSSPRTAWSSCSRLSPHLSWGTLSIRQVHHITRNDRINSVNIENKAGRLALTGYRRFSHFKNVYDGTVILCKS